MGRNSDTPPVVGSESSRSARLDPIGQTQSRSRGFPLLRPHPGGARASPPASSFPGRTNSASPRVRVPPGALLHVDQSRSPEMGAFPELKAGSGETPIPAHQFLVANSLHAAAGARS